MKPKNAPSHIYWVEAIYETSDRRQPMGGKFTRWDSAKARRDKVLEAGGKSRIFESRRLRWEEVDEGDDDE